MSPAVIMPLMVDLPLNTFIGHGQIESTANLIITSYLLNDEQDLT